MPEFRLPRFLATGDSRTSAVDPAGVAAGDVVNWIRNDAEARPLLKGTLGEPAFSALQDAVGNLAPAAGFVVKSASPYQSLETALEVLDARFSDESGGYVLPLGTTFVLEFTGDYRFVKRAQPYEFDFVYQNLDRVESTRPLLIHVRDDQPPVVELASDVIRRVGNVYYVTPKAKHPVRQRELRQGRQRPLQAGIHLHALPRGFGDRSLDADRARDAGHHPARGRGSRRWCRVSITPAPQHARPGR